MATSTQGPRYAVLLNGANLAPADVDSPTHAIMVHTLDDAVDMLRAAARGYYLIELRGDGGETVAAVPGYGTLGDWADIYVVDYMNAEFADVLDEPGDRARHAWQWTDFGAPVLRATFGPRGGVRLERC